MLARLAREGCELNRRSMALSVLSVSRGPCRHTGWGSGQHALSIDPRRLIIKVEVASSLGTPKGAKFSEEHVRNLTESHMRSKKWRDGRKRAAAKMRGRAPSLAAIAGSLATRTIQSLGLTRNSAPILWEAYFQLHMARLRARRDALAA